MKITRLKNNVYLLNYDINFYKIFKVSVNEQEYLSEYEAYKILLEKQNNYNVENFADYYEFKDVKIDSDIEFKINDKNIKIKVRMIIDDLLYFEDNNINIVNLYILSGDYNKNNVTFDKILKNKFSTDIINIINNIFINLSNTNKVTNFHHCDFKLDNILLKEKTIPSIIDLDFSLFLPENEFIIVVKDDDPKINLYLKLKKGKRIYGSFLKIFDLYLFALGLIYHYKNNKILINIKDLILEYIKNNECCEYFIMFYIIYCNLLLFDFKLNNQEIYLYHTEYNVIKNVLKNIYKIIEEDTQIIFYKYINLFDFINSSINL